MLVILNSCFMFHHFTGCQGHLCLGFLFLSGVPESLLGRWRPRRCPRLLQGLWSSTAYNPGSDSVSVKYLFQFSLSFDLYHDFHCPAIEAQSCGLFIHIF